MILNVMMVLYYSFNYFLYQKYSKRKSESLLLGTISLRNTGTLNLESLSCLIRCHVHYRGDDSL